MMTHVSPSKPPSAHIFPKMCYNAMNTLQGYQPIAIYSPREVIRYEDEEV